MHTPPTAGVAESSPDWKRQCPHIPAVVTIPAQPLFPIAPLGWYLLLCLLSWLTCHCVDSSFCGFTLPFVTVVEA